MNKNMFIAYLCLSFIAGSGVFYFVGYSVKHPPQYIYVRYNNISNNLIKAMNDCGIQTTKDQQRALFERLKIERGNK
jgi:hypothetical protein